jgi:hypothetical protein
MIPRVHKTGERTIISKGDGQRGENVYANGQKALTLKGKRNFDRIFKRQSVGRSVGK